MDTNQTEPKKASLAATQSTSSSMETHATPVDNGKQANALPKGQLETLRLGWIVVGWAVPSEGSDKSAEILIIREGKVLAKSISNKPRPDIAKQNNIEGINCGFEFDLRALSRHVRLNVGDNLMFAIAGEPIVLLSSKPFILPDYFRYANHYGFLDGINEEGWVYGWAINPVSPGSQMEVHFHIENQWVGSTHTHLERNDVIDAGFEGKRAGFLDILTKHFDSALLRPGSKLKVTFDEQGQAQLDGGPIELTEDHVSSIVRSMLHHAFQNPDESDLSASDLMQLLSSSILSNEIPESERVELIEGIMLGGLLDQYDKGIFNDVNSTLENLIKEGLSGKATIEIVLLHCLTLMALGKWNEISTDAINSAALSRMTDTEMNVQRKRYGNNLLVKLFERIYHEAALVLLITNNDGPASLFSELLNCLSQWCYRLTHQEELTLNLIELNTVAGAGSNQNHRLVQIAQLYRHNHRDAKALRILIDEIHGETTNWYPYHEVAVITRSIMHRYSAIKSVNIDIATQYFQRAEALNSDQSLSQREAWGLLHDYFNIELSHSASMARQGRLEQAIKRRQEMLDLLVNLAGRLNSNRRNLSGHGNRRWGLLNDKKIILWGSRDLYQCFYYRVQEKLDQARSLGFKMEFMDLSEYNGLDWMRKLMGAGLVIACRIPATINEIRYFTYAKSLGIPIIYDIDDLIFDPEAFPPSLSTYAGTIDKDFHRHLALDNPFFKTALKLADHCISSTQPLADEIRRHIQENVEVTVLPNLLSQEIYYWAISQSSKDQLIAGYKGKPDGTKLTIFYGSATKAHKQCFYETCLPALIGVIQKYHQVNLSLVGYFEGLPKSLIQADRICIHEPTSNYHEYLSMLRMADINIAVLEPSRATDCKSEIKWLEAAAFGIPSIVSPTATYRKTLQDGNTALFASDTQAWFEQLSRFIEGEAFRMEIGQNARKHAFEHFSPRVGEEILANIIRGYWKPHNEATKRRLLFVNVFYQPQSIGGATRVMESQIRGLQEFYADDYDIFVLTTHADPDPEKAYRVDQYWHGSVLVTRLNIPSKDWSEPEDSKVREFCEEFYATYSFDLLHIHSIQVLTASVALAAQNLNIKYVVTLHDAWWLSRYLFLVDEYGSLVDPRNPISGGAPPKEEEITQRIERSMILRGVLTNASLALAVSKKFAAIYKDTGFDNIKVHENASEPFDPIPHSRAPHDKLILGFIGGMSRHKGYHLVRQALEESELPEFKALIVDHSLQPGESYHTVWGKTEVEFIPKVKQREIPKLYSEMDILLAPSIWPESYGLVTREALQAGVWVIASDRGAIGDCVVEGKNGNLIDVSNCDALKNALIKLAHEGIPKISEELTTLKVKSCEEHIRELVGHYASVM